MRLSYFFLSIIFFLPSLFTNSYSININTPKLCNKKSKTCLFNTKKFISNPINNNLVVPIKKVNGFLELIRYKNILPTTFLFFSGAWMIKPNFIDLVKDKNVIYSLICTLLILSSNMIANDLFDIKIDKINNPGRPLISGKIKIKEAIFGLGFMLIFTEFINMMLLPTKLQNVIHLSILYTLMYTPLFKKILFLKNISCASMVAYSIFFGGLSVWKNGMDVTKIKYFYQIIIFVFFGSLYNEILLDVCDYEGDKKNKLYTIPTVFGPKMAINFSKNILISNVYGNLAYLFKVGQFYFGCLFFFLCIPILNDFYNIENENQSILENQNGLKKQSIIEALNTSSIQLIFILILFCLLIIR
jgi:geranylgeranylglycerol-phosphate geranylgeranyltransferase